MAFLLFTFFLTLFRELRLLEWEKPLPAALGHNVNSLIKRMNDIAYWVATSILINEVFQFFISAHSKESYFMFHNFLLLSPFCLLFFCFSHSHRLKWKEP